MIIINIPTYIFITKLLKNISILIKKKYFHEKNFYNLNKYIYIYHFILKFHKIISLIWKKNSEIIKKY